jgi:nucleoside-diphosphate-sugar epimerase
MCGERMARGFARRFGIDVYVLRLGAVVAPDEYGIEIKGLVEETKRGRMVGWSYADVRDLGRMADLCIKTDGLGYQVFNATNDRVTSTTRTEELLRRECPETGFTRGMGEWEAPFTNAKIKKMLRFEEVHD